MSERRRSFTRVAVSGHRGLPSDVEAYVAAEIGHELRRLTADHHQLVGVSCLADGADQIFARAVLAAGGTLEAVIPADDYRAGLPPQARAGLDDLLNRATAVLRCPHPRSTPTAYMDASRLMIDRADRLIAVWDGRPARSFGGTGDVVDYAREKSIPTVVIWPPGVTRT
ncbi:hypothetical protein GCM10010172_27150 [Paractinoplanes ferrugineus]|uniref:DNA recombination-mediator protein A n=1 Tax=Paractinoplanes ferrugineus TaxID=113564 RepID=A0A919ITS3_9ACTN|nr:hypothetical protein [Actinoplanes ferrugineus]GIE08375.1 hypothetical protein Afe05nite_02150 [Actinoplanes ferrugineus]